MIRVRRLIKKALFAATVVVATGFLFTAALEKKGNSRAAIG